MRHVNGFAAKVNQSKPDVWKYLDIRTQHDGTGEEMTLLGFLDANDDKRLAYSVKETIGEYAKMAVIEARTAKTLHEMGEEYAESRSFTTLRAHVESGLKLIDGLRSHEIENGNRRDREWVHAKRQELRDNPATKTFADQVSLVSPHPTVRYTSRTACAGWPEFREKLHGAIEQYAEAMLQVPYVGVVR